MTGILFIPVMSIARILWEHISSKTGTIEMPNSGKQQPFSSLCQLSGTMLCMPELRVLISAGSLLDTEKGTAYSLMQRYLML